MFNFYLQKTHKALRLSRKGILQFLSRMSSPADNIYRASLRDKSLTGFTPLEIRRPRCLTVTSGNLSLTGFTLVEIMVVIGIIALLLGVAIPSVNTYRRRAKEGKAKAQIEALGIAIKMYQVDTGSYPTDLVSDLDGTYMEFKDEEVVEGEFVDPWENPYQYSAPGSHNTASFDIYSWGNDEEDDSGGDDDITNW